MANLYQGGSTNFIPGVTLPPVGTPIVGVKAASPAANVPAPTNTLPKAQAATAAAPTPVTQKDLSGTYANVGGTLYNTRTQTKFATPQDFFKDSGETNFNNLKFNQSYTPTGNEGIYQAAPPPQAPTPQAPTPQPSSGTLPSLAQTTAQTSNPSTPYTPPNQGTTGVSQGGLIGNLTTNALNNPGLDAARADLKGLTDEYAHQHANIAGSAFGLSEQTGQQGILQQLYATRLGAAQTAVQNALSGQSNTTSGLSAAASANAPITNPQTGGLVSPSANTTTGATTSGAGNLSSLVGAGNGQNGHPAGEYFNTQTGKGFSTPQELADFVNSQLPGSNATAANVFDILKQQSQNPSGGALNPLNNVASIAQQVLNHQISPQNASAMGGTIANWQGLLNQELQKQSGGSYDQSALQAAYDANQSTQGNQAQLVATYTSAKQQANNLSNQFVDLLKTYGLNPSEFTTANGVAQTIASNVSDPRYAALKNYVTDIQNTYATILGAGGTITNDVRDTAKGMLDSLASGQSLQSVINVLDQQAQAKIAGVQTPSIAGGGGNKTTSGGNAPGGFGWLGN